MISAGPSRFPGRSLALSVLAALVLVPAMGCDPRPTERIQTIYQLKADPTEENVRRIRALLELVYCTAGFFVIAALLNASYPLFIKAWDRNTFVGTVGDFIAPIWPVKLIILVGCVALLMQLAMAGIRAAFGIWTGTIVHPDSEADGHDTV